jgi:hypothetical protein
MRTKHLTIAGQRWRIEWRARPMVERQAVYGWCDPGQQRILVSNKLAADAQRITLLHEVLHAIHSAGADHHPKEEDRCVNVIAAGLYQIVRQAENAWLLDYILEGNGGAK